MSDTDKTKPWLVRIMEHQLTPQHDHRDGTCNLPESPIAEYHSPREVIRSTDCTWSHYMDSAMPCCAGCGCRECTGYYWRKTERRSSRHRAVQRNSALLKIANAGYREDVDED